MAEDTYFCGNCNRYQRSSQGEKCVGCGRQTVTVGYVRSKDGKIRQETPEELKMRWKKLYGGR